MGEYSLGQALKQYLRQSKLKGNIQSFQILDIWEKIMGKTIYKYTDSIQIVNQTLFISTAVGPLKNELILQKDKIIQLVNEELGENIIKEVVIR